MLAGSCGWTTNNPPNLRGQVIAAEHRPLSQVHASFESDCQKCHAADFGIGLSPDSLQLDSSAR